MMPLLCLRLLSEAREDETGWSLAAEWLMQGEDGAIRGKGVTDFRGLADLLDPSQTWVHDPDNVLLLVPHDQILEVTLNVPGKTAAQIRRALPFAVEEFASADIETLHIASDRIRAGKPVRCQLLDRRLLDNWLQCLRSLGIEPGYLVADTELLPTDDRTTHVLIDGPSVLVRSPTEAAMVDRGNLLMALQMIAPASIKLAGGRLEPLEIAQLPDTEVIQIESVKSSIEYLVSHWHRNPDINLLQGAYAPTRKSGGHAELWRPVALVTILWIAIAWLLMIGEGFWADWKSETLDAQARSLYIEIFPADTNVRNVRRSLADKLGQNTGSGGRGFAQLTADLATALDSSAELRSLEFEEGSGELKAEILIGDHAAVEAVNSKLKQIGIESQLLNAIQEEQKIRAYFLLRSTS